MSVSIIRKPIYGSLLEYNKLCSGEPYISIPGNYAKAPARLNIDNDIMSKHILMSGGTGSGKPLLSFAVFPIAFCYSK